MQIFLDPTEISAMKAACEDAAKVLDFLTPHVKEGVTTAYLDKITIEFLNDVLHVKSATIGYGPKGHPPFPSSICTSINHVVCHGIPNDKPLKDGDIMNIDVTIIKDGYFGILVGCFLLENLLLGLKFYLRPHLKLCGLVFQKSSQEHD